MTTTAKPEQLRARRIGSLGSTGVDRDYSIINGYVVAETGDFKDKRGHFDASSLEKIVELGNQDLRGLRTRLSHPNQSDDGLTKHLGRSKNFRVDGNKVRADLHLAKVALEEPVGGGKPIGKYAMDLAEEDPGALGSSLVLKTARAKREVNGEVMPDLWTPEELFASDLVADGDAVHGDLLSAEGLDDYMDGSDRRIPTKLAVVGSEYLDKLFPESDREVLTARIDAWRDRYLSNRFGSDSTPPEQENDIMDEETKKEISKLETAVGSIKEELAADIAKFNETLSSFIEKQDAAAGESSRSAEIAALCKQAGYPDTEQLLADENLSVECARAKIFDWKCSQSNDLGTSEDPGGLELTKIEKLRRSWDDKKEDLRAVGYTDRETWLRHECRDQDVEYEAPAGA